MSRGGLMMALVLSFIFMRFLNGDIGWALIYTLGGASVASIVIMLISERHFTTQLIEVSGVTECGRDIDVEIELQKTGFCILPCVELVVNVGSDELPAVIRTSLIFGKKKRVSTRFKAHHCGLNEITLISAAIYDFAGIAAKRAPINQTTQKAVLPRIIEYDGPNIIPNTLPSEEEAEEGITVLAGGMPGYEHREYFPGDSPRRVNYKLSAKKGTLMVRLDESLGTKTVNLFIADNAMPICADKAFALASRLVVRGGSVKITHKNETHTASTPETLERMREWLAFREFVSEPDQFAESLPPSDTSIVFSAEGIMNLVSAA